MDKKTAIIIVVCLIGFISFRVYIAFQHSSESDRQNVDEFPLDLPAVYTGVIPCASCPGIRYHLLIEQTGFTETRWYADRDESPYVKNGSWTITADTLTILDESESYTQSFLIEESVLYMLDQNKNKITGELEDQYRLDLSREESSIRKQHRDLKEEGVEFLASGNEPFWNVQIMEHDSVTFQTPEAEYSAKLISSQENDTLKFQSEFEERGLMELTAQKQLCQDSMSGFLFTHTVSVSIDDEELTGCGRYLVGN